jgi:hypothetical protein
LLATSFLEELAELDLLDANVRLGPSASHGHLALEADALLAEMDRFRIRQALVSHWTAEEYDAAAGNRALARDLRPRLLPAWTALPAEESLGELVKLAPRAVRLTPGKKQHNYSLSRWCSDALLDYLEQYSVVTLLSMQDVGWEEVAAVLDNFPCLQLVLLDLGYRADRYLFPLLDHHSGLHFDSATYLAHRQLEAFIEQRGADRVLFGSRLPLFTPGSALGVLASARISQEEKRAVAGGNLRRLLAAARTSAPEVQA